jgi:hypothetical protein
MMEIRLSEIFYCAILNELGHLFLVDINHVNFLIIESRLVKTFNAKFCWRALTDRQ